MYRCWYRRYFFLTSLVGTRYSVLLLRFVRNGALIYPNSIQTKKRKSEDNGRPTPLAADCSSCGYGSMAVYGVTESKNMVCDVTEKYFVIAQGIPNCSRKPVWSLHNAELAWLLVHWLHD